MTDQPAPYAEENAAPSETEDVFRIVIHREKPPGNKYVRTANLVQCTDPNGAMRIAQEFVGRTGKLPSYWALIPSLEIAGDQDQPVDLPAVSEQPEEVTTAEEPAASNPAEAP